MENINLRDIPRYLDDSAPVGEMNSRVARRYFELLTEEGVTYFDEMEVIRDQETGLLVSLDPRNEEIYVLAMSNWISNPVPPMPLTAMLDAMPSFIHGIADYTEDSAVFAPYTFTVPLDAPRDPRVLWVSSETTALVAGQSNWIGTVKKKRRDNLRQAIKHVEREHDISIEHIARLPDSWKHWLWTNTELKIDDFWARQYQWAQHLWIKAAELLNETIWTAITDESYPVSDHRHYLCIAGHSWKPDRVVLVTLVKNNLSLPQNIGQYTLTRFVDALASGQVAATVGRSQSATLLYDPGCKCDMTSETFEIYKKMVCNQQTSAPQLAVASGDWEGVPPFYNGKKWVLP